MKTLLTIALFLLVSSLLSAQKYQFSSIGTMKQSRIEIDTIIKTNFGLNNEIAFEKITDGIDRFNLRQRLPKIWLSLSAKNTGEYFILANLTNKNITIKRINRHLVAEEHSMNNHSAFTPINFFYYPMCTSGEIDEDLLIRPSEILIIKNRAIRSFSILPTATNSYMQLLTSSNGILTSNRYFIACRASDYYLNNKWKNQIQTNRLPFYQK